MISTEKCEHNEVMRGELADGSHDWQCVTCGKTFDLGGDPKDGWVYDLPKKCGCARTFGYDGPVACICDPRYEARSLSTDTGRELISRLHDAAQEPMAAVIASIEAEARVSLEAWTTMKPYRVPPELRDVLAEAAKSGPWRREPSVAPLEEFRARNVIWLTNEAGDWLMLNADDVAMLINAALECPICDGAISGQHYHRDTADGEEIVRTRDWVKQHGHEWQEATLEGDGSGEALPEASPDSRYLKHHAITEQES